MKIEDTLFGGAPPLEVIEKMKKRRIPIVKEVLGAAAPRPVSWGRFGKAYPCPRCGARVRPTNDAASCLICGRGASPAL